MQVETDQITTPVETGEVARDMDMFIQCAFYSFRPSVYSFFGEAESILEKMDAIPDKLSDLRTFILAVENDSSAEVRLYERVDGDKWAVSSWSGPAIGDLNARMADAIMANSGVLCIGEQLKGLLTSELDLTLEGVVPAPASARAAFGHAVRGLGTDTFMRATTALLC
jgi:hypothetical protein